MGVDYLRKTFFSYFLYCLAYFYANTRYTLFKELPTGKGYADLVLIPYLPNIPAMEIELKHYKRAGSTLQKIKEKLLQSIKQLQRRPAFRRRKL